MAKTKSKNKGKSRRTIASLSAVERFVKDQVDRRLASDAKEGIAQAIDELTLRLVVRAAELADQEGRSTLFQKDVEASLAALTARETNPDSVFSTIDQLTTEQLADLVNAIRAWLKERPGT